MVTSNLQNVYEKLKAREKEYQRYARPSYLIAKSFFLGFISILLSSVLIGSYFRQTELVQIYLGITIFAWLLFIKVSTDLLDKKARVYRLNADERALFRTCSILENLDNYFDTEKPELKKEYRKNALLNAKNLLSTVENEWTIGDFELARKHFGDSIYKFKKNLRNRLIPHIEEGDESILKGIEQVMYNFAQVLRNPSVSDLNHINKSIAKKMGFRPLPKESPLTKCSNFLKVHKVLRHALVTIILGIGCYFVYFLGINYDLASKDVTFGTAIGLFGILFVGYWQYIKKEKEIIMKL